MHVLIVKVSSLGDIIHTLPAVTDAARANKGITFDWVVEEAFTEIPAWHPAVDKVIPVAFRRWRKNLIKTWRSGEFGEFKRNLQSRHYDLVIDAQGLIKSGFISRLSRGLTVGLSHHAIREKQATMFYNIKYTVPWQQHAVTRVRDLFSRTFDYSVEQHSFDYGIDTTQFSKDKSKDNTLVFFHGTTWGSKMWPLEYWQKLAQIAESNGMRVQLLWGNKEEEERAKAIASVTKHTEVLGRLPLNEIARLLVKSQGVIAVDTGLAHLAAALDVPVVSIYGASNPELTGTFGYSQLHLNSSFECSPCMNKNCQYADSPVIEQFDGNSFNVLPACYSDNPPVKVWGKIQGLIQGGKGTLDDLFYPRPRS